MKDGKQLQGILSRETKDEIVVRIAGIDTPLKADTIDRYQILPPILERYRQYRASMGDDPDKILTLVSWLQAREQYELALVETERVLKLDPNNKQAAKVKTMIKSQMELRDNSKGRKKDKPQVPTTQPSEADKARDAFPLLSDQQINLLKVYEIDLANPPRVNISRDTITKMLQTHAGSPLLPATQEGRDAIYRKSPHEVLDLLFKLRARELYAEVQVVDHPAAFKLFRDDVQAAWLVNGCATSACHGGTDAGRLMLMNRKPRADATVYTNFLILDRFRLDDGTPLINYDDPEKSPLLQMALPREDSTRKHPEVPRGLRSHDAWKPTLRTAQDRGFVDTVAWIRSMYRPRPQYPIEYRPPRPSERETPANKEPSPR